MTRESGVGSRESGVVKAAIMSSVSRETIESLAQPLERANREFSRRYPGESSRRQPVHTVYGGGHLFRSDTAQRMGAVALSALEEYAPDGRSLASATGLDVDMAELVRARVAEKLQREPVEDFRIDFEDGYGNRPDDEEDGHVAGAAREVARGLIAGTLPYFIGIRVKPLNQELRARSVRTLDAFLSSLLAECSGKLPENLVITLPKVTIPEQTAFFSGLLEHIERNFGLAAGSLRFEIMVETPQAVLGHDGAVALPAIVSAGRGRIMAAHFGTYDYTASINITAGEQRMQHPACSFALHAMQIALAGTGIWLSDGSTAILPVPVNRAAEGGSGSRLLSALQLQENLSGVHRAWRQHFDDVRNSLANGFYQGWDLHPAQLVTRYAAIYSFFLSGLDAAAARLRNFVEKAAQATLIGDVFDDAATGQGLLNFFLRATASGAISENEVVARTGVTQDELRGRSFVAILRNRAGR
ncbi:MAG: phosphoenolpyruvate kinase [Gemmatimonadaceae bacterium]